MYYHSDRCSALFAVHLHSDAYCLKQCLQERFFTELHKIEVDGERVPMPQPISWYVCMYVYAYESRYPVIL